MSVLTYMVCVLLSGHGNMVTRLDDFLLFETLYQLLGNYFWEKVAQN